MKRMLSTVLGLALFASACADPVAPAAPTPVTPTVTETFSDTLLGLGSNTHQFSIQQIGGVKVTLSDVTPPTTVAFGLGAQSIVGCTLLTQLTVNPGGTAELAGTLTTVGNFCIIVFDAGSLVEPVAYKVTVLHS
jgi:hypothetical protein